MNNGPQQPDFFIVVFEERSVFFSFIVCVLHSIFDIKNFRLHGRKLILKFIRKHILGCG